MDYRDSLGGTSAAVYHQVEAQEFSRDRQGQVHLVSQSRPVSPRAQATCQGLQRSLSQEAAQ